MEQGDRWQSSVRTFGPVGRLLATILVLWVFLWFVRLGPVGVVGIVVWGGFVMPWALRDIWRRAHLPETDLTQLQRQAGRDRELLERPERQHLALDPDAEPPTRW